MSLQILGGTLKGCKINVVDNKDLRPTSVMLRRKLFDAHQDLREYLFIDCFSGTGAIGFEALSRGAKEVFLIEKNKDFFTNIKLNFNELNKVSKKKLDSVLLIKSSFESYVPKFRDYYLKLPESDQKNTILFWDPPYDKHDLYQMITKIFDKEWFKGQFWIESDRQKGPEKLLILNNKLVVKKEYKAGGQFVLICSM